MKNNSFKDIWVEVDGMLTPTTKQELRKILSKKVQTTLWKFYSSLVVSLLLSAGVLFFLIYAAFKQSFDTFYVINNVLAGALVVLYLVHYSNILIRAFNLKAAGLQLNTFLTKNIHLLSRSFSTYLDIILAPFLGLLLLLAVHGYYSVSEISLIIDNPETLWGLLFGIIAVGVAGFVTVRNVRNYFTKQLSILKHYKEQLFKED
jgi:hypothetical protein